MVCLFCASRSHTIRTCESIDLDVFIQTFQEIQTPNMMFFRLDHYSTAMLSVIMARVYNAPNLSGTREHKIQWIKDHTTWLNDLLGLETETSSPQELNNWLTIEPHVPETSLTWFDWFKLQLCFILTMNGHTEVIGNSLRPIYNDIMDLDMIKRSYEFIHWFLIMFYFVMDILNNFVDILWGHEDPDLLPEVNTNLPKLSICVRSPLQNQIKMNETNECAVCFEKYDQQVGAFLGCYHSFCVHCILNMGQKRLRAFIKCPLCRETIKAVEIQDHKMRNYFKANSQRI